MAKTPMRALSIRQPYVEQIMRGVKRIEYRSRRTNVRERVYVYASLTPGDVDVWDELKMRPGELPTGVLVGTVEIVGCSDEPDSYGDYHWYLASPRRLKRPVKPERHPQPAWFYPF